MTETVANVSEHPVFFEGPDGPVFGIVTRSPEAIGNVVICGGGWEGGNNNANRVVPRLARRLAAHGMNVVRFDWHGAGESPGNLRSWTLENPGEDVALAAVEVARREANLPTSLIGVCIGSRSVLAAAPHVPDLAALAVVSFPVPEAQTKAKRAERVTVRDALRQSMRRSTLRGWFQPATRRVYVKFLRIRWRILKKKLGLARAPDERMRRQTRVAEDNLERLAEELDALVDRGVDVLFLFGDSDPAYQSFLSDESLERVRRRSQEHVQVATGQGDLSGFSSLEAQDTLIEIIPDWFVERHTAR